MSNAAACVAVKPVHRACSLHPCPPISISFVLTAVTGKLHEEDQEEQTTPEADQEQGIATNIKVKEVLQVKPIRCKCKLPG